MEFTLLGAALTGVGGAWAANRILARHIAVARPTDSVVAAAAIGLLVGRVAAMLAGGINPLLHPGDLVIVRAGVHTGFASLGALAALVWMHRRALPESLGELAPASLAGLAGWHGGCVWRDACLGVTTDLPWAMSSPGTAVGRHPVELYALAAYVLAAAIVARIMRRGWLAAGLGLTAAGGVRLATEPLRLSITGGPVGWYAAAIVVGLAVAAFGQRRTRTRPPGPSSIEM